eukprot:scaffold21744_cov63-Phaeocystis_antarctica.AAC.2
MAGFMAILGSSVDALVMSPGRVLSTAQPALSLSMAAPKGPWGGSTDSSEGWFMDRGQSAQVKKFEGGSDYLFFQGPSPLLAARTAAIGCHPNPDPNPNPLAGEPRRRPRERESRAAGSRRRRGRRYARRSRPGAARLRSSVHSVRGPASSSPALRACAWKALRGEIPKL